MTNYRNINYTVMMDTKKQCESNPELIQAIRFSIEHQYMVAHEDDIDQPHASTCQTQFICSGKRSFEAAKAYKGKKVAVLNFANNHAIGGAPFSAGAQEESLCRCSTLFPCLEAMRVPFYQKHINDYEHHRISKIGNDDLIYTPDVVVFKSDERTDPIIPQMLPREEWYKVDIITCAAPEFRKGGPFPANYEQIIDRRIKKIIDVAVKEKVEVLILGAWGCGAFGNDPKVVSSCFYSHLEQHNFEIVEFALASNGDVSNSPFARTSRLGNNNQPAPDIIMKSRMDIFMDVPLFEETNEEHQLLIQITLDGDRMDLTYNDELFASDEYIMEYATFDARAVRQHYHAASNQALIARLVMDYNICGNGASVYDDLIAYLHENGIFEYDCRG